MDILTATTAFSALGLEARLSAMRLLIKAGAEGMPAGAIAEALGVKQNTMSAHLAILMAAGLIRSEREGRVIRYFMNMGAFKDLLTFLLEDCCGGDDTVCRPLINTVMTSCDWEKCNGPV